jgi:hypothetical protein
MAEFATTAPWTTMLSAHRLELEGIYSMHPCAGNESECIKKCKESGSLEFGVFAFLSAFAFVFPVY